VRPSIVGVVMLSNHARFRSLFPAVPAQPLAQCRLAAAAAGRAGVPGRADGKLRLRHQRRAQRRAPSCRPPSTTACATSRPASPSAWRCTRKCCTPPAATCAAVSTSAVPNSPTITICCAWTSASPAWRRSASPPSCRPSAWPAMWPRCAPKAIPTTRSARAARATVTAITHIQPLSTRNRRAFGYDMFTEPVRRAAMEAARDGDRAAATGKVVLVQEGAGKEAQSGFLIYLPVYRAGQAHATIQERRAALIGWVYAPFRMQDLMRGVGGEQAGDLEVEIFDGLAPERGHPALPLARRARRRAPRAVLDPDQRSTRPAARGPCGYARRPCSSRRWNAMHLAADRGLRHRPGTAAGPRHLAAGHRTAPRAAAGRPHDAGTARIARPRRRRAPAHPPDPADRLRRLHRHRPGRPHHRLERPGLQNCSAGARTRRWVATRPSCCWRRRSAKNSRPACAASRSAANARACPAPARSMR
jgi:hypothetical protein